MQQDTNPEPIGGQFGAEVVDSGEQRATRYCECERQRIQLANEPRILAVRAESQLLINKADKLVERIRNAPPAGDVRSRRRKAIFYWGVAGVLIVSGFYFTRLTFEPFRLGATAWIIACGAAVIVPFLLDWVLERWGNEMLTRILGTTACVAALTALALLATIRCDLLKQQIQNLNASVVVNGDSALPPPVTENTFYKDTAGRLQTALALLALAMEIAAGVAIYEARRYGRNSTDDPDALARSLADVQQKLLEHTHEVKRLENEPGEWANGFWRDFHRSTLNAVTRNGHKWLSVVLLCIGLVGSVRAFTAPATLMPIAMNKGLVRAAADTVNLVIAVDLSASVTRAKGLDGKTEFDQNLAGVGRLLAAAPAGSKITIIGITDRSFSQPYVLLSAQLDGDEGYFHERVANARLQLVRAWQKRCEDLASRFQRTDLVGSLVVATQLLYPGKGRNVLVIFSDMRQDTPELNLDRMSAVNLKTAIVNVDRDNLIPDLKGVEVHALGVDAAGKQVSYWNSLRAFWTEYFTKAGATLRGYSMFRELPSLAP